MIFLPLSAFNAIWALPVCCAEREQRNRKEKKLRVNVFFMYDGLD
jgi:hypothetical protein